MCNIKQIERWDIQPCGFIAKFQCEHNGNMWVIEVCKVGNSFSTLDMPSTWLNENECRIKEAAVEYERREHAHYRATIEAAERCA